MEAIADTFKSTMSSSETTADNGGSTGTHSRKSSRSHLTAASPGRAGGSGGGPYQDALIRKSRSTQLSMSLQDDAGSGVALSRASSASLGFSFPFTVTGFTVPPEEMADSKPFSDDDIPEDLEAGMQAPKFRAELTLPIYLKVINHRPFVVETEQKAMETFSLQKVDSLAQMAKMFRQFTDVTYKVVLKGQKASRDKENILNGITGAANPREILALMGPSGSGKTTLLNLLGRRLQAKSSMVGGSVTYNDQSYSKFLKSRIGFVTQDDVLFPHLTVKETLTYAALLRLPKTMSKDQKEKIALDVIYDLGLERCQDTTIGGLLVRGVSGGERKRACIGIEILVNPSLLLLDEPTSGLDSTTALRIVQMLQDIAEAGKTVVMTVHQPSSRLFRKFDKLILLRKGSLLYFGKSSEVMVYFSSIGCSPLIAMNPAEFLLDLANGNINDVSVPTELEDKLRMENLKTRARNGKPSPEDVHDYLVDAYETRVTEREKKMLLDPIQLNKGFKSKVASPKRQWGASWWQQYSILFCRGIKERKHEYFSWLRITQVVVTAVILGLLWWQSDCTTLKGLQDQAGLIFFIAVFWGFFPVFTAIFTFPQERAMLSKERAADVYRLSAYFVARTTSDLPLDLLLPLLFLLIVYFMAGLRLNAVCFFLTLLTVFLCIIAAQGLGFAIGATLMDLKKATTLASVTVMTFMLSGGFFVERVPVFMSWIRYVSFNYHTYKLLLKIQYRDAADRIDGVTVDTGWKEVTALAVMVVGYRLVAYISLRRMKLGLSLDY